MLGLVLLLVRSNRKIWVEKGLQLEVQTYIHGDRERKAPGLRAHGTVSLSASLSLLAKVRCAVSK